jgi:hypothetical protein
MPPPRKRPSRNANGSHRRQEAGPPKVHVILKAFEERLTQLEEAFNKNTKAFSDGIQMIEAQQEVLRRVLQGVVSGVVRTIDAADGSSRKLIDWNGYLKEYIEELVAKEAAKEEKAGPGPVLATADEDAPIIFGGDSP